MPITSVQFNLRGIFVLTGVVAGLLALIAAQFHRLESDAARRMFLAYWLTLFVCGVACMCLMCWQRRRTELKAGEKLARCQAGRRWKRLLPILLIFILAPIVINAGVLVAEIADQRAERSDFIVICPP